MTFFKCTSGFASVRSIRSSGFINPEDINIRILDPDELEINPAIRQKKQPAAYY